MILLRPLVTMYLLLLLFSTVPAFADDLTRQITNYDVTYRIDVALRPHQGSQLDVFAQGSGILSSRMIFHCTHYDTQTRMALRTASHAGMVTQFYSEHHQKEAADGSWYRFDTFVKKDRRVLVQETGQISHRHTDSTVDYDNPANLHKKLNIKPSFPISMQRLLWQAAENGQTIVHFPFFEGAHTQELDYYNATAIIGQVRQDILPVQLSYYAPSSKGQEMPTPVSTHTIHLQKQGPAKKITIETDSMTLHLTMDEVALSDSHCPADMITP